MTATTNGLPEWIRRKLLGEPATADHGETGSTTVSGGRNDQEPVVVWEAAHQMEAEIVKGRLEAEGIPAIIRSEALGHLYGLTSGGLAKADVLVPAALAEKAIDLLALDLVADDEQESEQDAGSAPEPDTADDEPISSS